MHPFEKSGNIFKISLALSKGTYFNSSIFSATVVLLNWFKEYDKEMLYQPNKLPRSILMWLHDSDRVVSMVEWRPLFVKDQGCI